MGRPDYKAPPTLTTLPAPAPAPAGCPRFPQDCGLSSAPAEPPPSAWCTALPGDTQPRGATGRGFGSDYDLDVLVEPVEQADQATGREARRLPAQQERFERFRAV
jgi:hypothetical protein